MKDFIRIRAVSEERRVYGRDDTRIQSTGLGGNEREGVREKTLVMYFMLLLVSGSQTCTCPEVGGNSEGVKSDI